MNTYFTSDPHFGHQNIIKYCNRPFKTAAEMDEKLIENWNNKVQKDDTVYVLGDFAFQHSKDKIVEILKRLNGNIIYVRGNHDGNAVLDALDEVGIPYSQLRDITIQDPEMPHGEQHITLCHYPMISWNKSHRGSWQLFGHHHGSKTSKCEIADKLTYAQLDVGVDGHDYTPVSYEEVKTIITKQFLGNE